MMLNLQLVFFFVCLVVESFKKIFIRHLVMCNIVVYYTTIIPNIANKMTDCMETR